jgi:hypothetical protein
MALSYYPIQQHAMPASALRLHRAAIADLLLVSTSVRLQTQTLLICLATLALLNLILTLSYHSRGTAIQQALP